MGTRKIIETEDEEPHIFKKTWCEARVTYPGIAQMDHESIGNKTMDWLEGALANTVNKDDGLPHDIRVEKNVYGLCGRACKLCHDKELWKADLKTWCEAPARVTYPGIAQMDHESIGSRRTSNGLCGRACKLCHDKESWKANLKTAVKSE
eukprot:Pgem_evm1s5917